MNDRVSISVQDGVADVRLNRPDKLNAFDDAMFAAVIGAGHALAETEGLRCVVLSGEGRAFCAGLDMARFAEMASGGGDGGRSLLTEERSASGANRAQQVAFVWRDLPVPVIAAVHGVTLGAGFQLALGADLRFATPDARLSAFEINWGLIPDMGGFPLLRQLVRDDVARDLVYSGRIVEGPEAAAIGLVTRLCDDPHAEALAYAREIAGRHPEAVCAAKRIFALAADADQANLLRAESREQAALIGSPNQREAAMARIEKRAPRFTG
jgi:enoyl-CoA hydratase/carnithine racemase